MKNINSDEMIRSMKRSDPTSRLLKMVRLLQEGVVAFWVIETNCFFYCGGFAFSLEEPAICANSKIRKLFFQTVSIFTIPFQLMATVLGGMLFFLIYVLMPIGAEVLSIFNEAFNTIQSGLAIISTSLLSLYESLSFYWKKITEVLPMKKLIGAAPRHETTSVEPAQSFETVTIFSQALEQNKLSKAQVTQPDMSDPEPEVVQPLEEKRVSALDFRKNKFYMGGGFPGGKKR